MKYEKKQAEERFCVQCGTKFMQPRARSYICKTCVDLGTRIVSRRYCSKCGTIFTPKNGEWYFCSDKCRGEEANANREKVRAPQSKKKKEKKETITSIQRKAQKEHLTYGQYVQKYGL
ncbi:MAG: hypothetical protein ACI3XA_04695 [Clostridia bacterium]